MKLFPYTSKRCQSLYSTQLLIFSKLCQLMFVFWLIDSCPEKKITYCQRELNKTKNVFMFRPSV